MYNSAFQVRRSEQNTALNAKTEQFITAKISGNAVKQRSWTYSVLRQRSWQLQKYKAAHCNSWVKPTQCCDRAVHNYKTYGCANVSWNSSRAEKVCGWGGGHPGL